MSTSTSPATKFLPGGHVSHNSVVYQVVEYISETKVMVSRDNGRTLVVNAEWLSPTNEPITSTYNRPTFQLGAFVVIKDSTSEMAILCGTVIRLIIGDHHRDLTIELLGGTQDCKYSDLRLATAYEASQLVKQRKARDALPTVADPDGTPDVVNIVYVESKDRSSFGHLVETINGASDKLVDFGHGPVDCSDCKIRRATRKEADEYVRQCRQSPVELTERVTARFALNDIVGIIPCKQAQTSATAGVVVGFDVDTDKYAVRAENRTFKMREDELFQPTHDDNNYFREMNGLPSLEDLGPCPAKKWPLRKIGAAAELKNAKKVCAEPAEPAALPSIDDLVAKADADAAAIQAVYVKTLNEWSGRGPVTIEFPYDTAIGPRIDAYNRLVDAYSAKFLIRWSAKKASQDSSVCENTACPQEHHALWRVSLIRRQNTQANKRTRTDE